MMETLSVPHLSHPPADARAPKAPRRTAFAGRAATLAVVAGALLAGCSTVENLLAGDKVDYKSTSTRSSSLEVPPDLTQLSRDQRYQLPASGTVNASTYAQAASGPNLTPAVSPSSTNAIAPRTLGAYSLERAGNERWLHTSLPAEEVYPQVKSFWRDNGFELVQDRPDAGVLETEWNQNRAKLPGDIIRNTIGKVFDSAFSTGELDKYRTRLERSANGTGTDIFITHRGMAESYIGQNRESTVWQPRPSDPELESEFLARLMVRLGGATQEQARTTVSAAGGTSTAPARARLVDAQPTPTLQVDDGFDRAWRRVGIALDRTGFTVEDRDRAQGVYYVRYVDPKFAGREEPGFFGRMWDRVRGKSAEDTSPVRYRVKVTAAGNASSSVAVLGSQGQPDNGEATRRIATLLLDDLK